MKYLFSILMNNNDPNAKTIFFSRQAEKRLVFFLKYLQKLTFCGVAINIINLILISILFSNCRDSRKALLGVWNCEVIIGEKTGIGFEYKMSFTKDKQWIPNLSKDLKLDYSIKGNKIVTKSEIGLNIYSEYSFYGNKLKIDTLGLLSECTKE